MEPQLFFSTFERLKTDLANLSCAMSDNPDLMAVLPLRDFTLFQNLVKEYLWIYDDSVNT